MKKLGLLGLGMLFIALSSFMAVKKETIIGTWKVNKVDLSQMLANLPDEDKPMMEMFLPVLEESFKTIEMTFAKTGEHSISNAMSGELSEEKGTWSLSADGQTLTTLVHGAESVYIIESATDKNLVLVFELEGDMLKLEMVMK
jgi:hypothetical protein